MKETDYQPRSDISSRNVRFLSSNVKKYGDDARLLEASKVSGVLFPLLKEESSNPLQSFYWSDCWVTKRLEGLIGVGPQDRPISPALRQQTVDQLFIPTNTHSIATKNI